ncbi:AAA family ATPase [Cyclobacteriaceae bacterium]|mgnify:FL=1|jgi:CO dehydrogenase maturation factor|nr:AAA family ATPase [Cyclobacteriaceae bacterium]MDB4741883.1 AAA family ATPase [Cyclobacteriaceae bacterium]MDB9883788.1 AAA family ATPase [Cyclobacteriaceae bacterium]MDB9939624.1 AAA family ATPase [Cyclobacteriaceae bacterium]MDC1234186.1 AAA family ATPase [Cyclobacteriaceae bacterium]|tara:strand:- start:2873 stop:3643 length:771 start_codon:yes stop_codon:yes gene_type:complete
MKIAIAGKGGVGKTTISGTLCRVLGKNGNAVLAIDGDPNPNLSVVLGIDKEAEMPKALSTDIIERIEESEGKWKFQVKMPFQEILDTYGQKAPDNVSLLMIGKPEKAGTGCMCGSHTVVRELIHSALAHEEEQIMVVDTEASLEHMKRGTSQYVDKMYTVVEPYYRSLEAAGRFADMANQLGIVNVEAIANKVRNAEEEQAIREFCKKINLPIAVILPFDEQVTDADLKGVSIMDYDKDAKVVKAMEVFVQTLELN